MNQSSKKTIVAVGDIAIFGEFSRYLLGQGICHARSRLEELLAGGDVTVGNLECPITDCEEKRSHQLWNLKMPTKLAPLLTVFNGLSLANNHILDFGATGLFDTIKELDRLGIMHCGAGKDSLDAATPVIINHQDFRIGMTAFTDRNWYPAGKERPGTNIWRGKSSHGLIKKLSETTDFVIVQIHQGYEFIHYPGPEEIEMAEKVIEAGADLVLGHHSHTIMGITRVEKGVIAYGLGNFIFNHSSKRYAEKVCPRMICRFHVDRHHVLDWQISPVVPDTHGWPVPASESENEEIMHRFTEISTILENKEETIRLFKQEAHQNMLPHAFRALLKLLRKEGLRAVLIRLRRLRRVDFLVVFSPFWKRKGEHSK